MTARSLHELFAAGEPAWPAVEGWISSARNHVEALPVNVAERDQVLRAMQVTLQSPMGAILYNTGGVLVDHGWIRILGSGSPRFPRSLPEWNRGRSIGDNGDRHGFCLVADDVIGGFFALNGGAFDGPKTEVFYFAPDSLRWENLAGIGYTEFLNWSFNSDLDRFYGTLRWPGWQSEIATLSGDEALSIYPPLFTKEGKSISTCSRKRCSISEVFYLNVVEFPRQMKA